MAKAASSLIKISFGKKKGLQRNHLINMIEKRETIVDKEKHNIYKHDNTRII